MSGGSPRGDQVRAFRRSAARRLGVDLRTREGKRRLDAVLRKRRSSRVAAESRRAAAAAASPDAAWKLAADLPLRNAVDGGDAPLAPEAVLRATSLAAVRSALEGVRDALHGWTSAPVRVTPYAERGALRLRVEGDARGVDANALADMVRAALDGLHPNGLPVARTRGAGDDTLYLFFALPPPSVRPDTSARPAAPRANRKGR